MKQLLNTLFITEEDARLRYGNQNLVVEFSDDHIEKVPLCRVDNIISFTWQAPTAQLMTYCAGNGIGMAFLGNNGNLRYQIHGEIQGNVLVRRNQVLMIEDEGERLQQAKTVVDMKYKSQIYVIETFIKNHRDDVQEAARIKSLEDKVQTLNQLKEKAKSAESTDQLRGIEGISAKVYFSAFSQMILNEDPLFRFTHRTKCCPAN